MTEFEIDNLISDLKGVIHALESRNSIQINMPYTQPSVTMNTTHNNQMLPYTTNYPTISATPSTSWTITLPVDFRNVDALRKTIKLLEHTKAALRFIELPG